MISLNESQDDLSQEDKESLLSLIYGCVTQLFGEIYITTDYTKLIRLSDSAILVEDKFYSKVMLQYLTKHSDNYIAVILKDYIAIFALDGTDVHKFYYCNATSNNIKITEAGDTTVIEYKDDFVTESIIIDNSTNILISKNKWTGVL